MAITHLPEGTYEFFVLGSTRNLSLSGGGLSATSLFMKMRTAPLLVVISLLTIFGVIPAECGPLTQPASGSAERKAVLDAIRPRAQGELGGAVEFVVKEMRVQDNFCFTRLEPQRPGGAKIAKWETNYAQEEFMDGLTIFALLGKTGSGWMIIEYVVGPTDVAYLPWPDQHGAPRSIFGL
jgi:hypothetical protein